MNNQHDHNNLNEISHQSALSLCREALGRGFRVTHIYADTVGDPQFYTRFIRNRLEDYADIVKQITIQPKADRDHKVVSAASICAKVTRDKIIKNWTFR
jgi:ribonuclease H2 subunit A